MTTHAMQVLAKTFEASAFTGDTMKGTVSEGGAIWTVAQQMFQGATWDSVFCQIDFEDGSAIEYQRDPSSMFNTTYKAVSIMPTKLVSQAQQVIDHVRLSYNGLSFDAEGNIKGSTVVAIIVRKNANEMFPDVVVTHHKLTFADGSTVVFEDHTFKAV